MRKGRGVRGKHEGQVQWPESVSESLWSSHWMLSQVKTVSDGPQSCLGGLFPESGTLTGVQSVVDVQNPWGSTEDEDGPVYV